jgi:putative membrane protein
METFLAIFHYLMIFTTVALLLGEFLLLRLDATGPGLKLLGKVDLLYGVFALLVVVSGLMRVFLGDVAPVTWSSNHAFWTKMAVFAVIGGLSVVPSLRFQSWRRAFAAGGTLPDAAARKKAGRFVHIELGLFVLMPILAVLMVAAAEKASGN